MTQYKINAAIQLLPNDTEQKRWDVVDKAIALIHQSGLNYKVCPFETVVEGTSSQIFELLEKIKTLSLQNANEILINVKIHAANKDVFFEEKLEKY